MVPQSSRARALTNVAVLDPKQHRMKRQRHK
jgi:hypothetical protein